MNDNNKFLVPLIITLVFGFGLWLGTQFMPKNTIQIVDSQVDSKISTILNLIDKKYVDTVDYNLLLESSIEGMIKKLDPHSQYIPPKDLDFVNEQLDGQFGGVGIRFLIHEDTLVVTHVLENSPSERSGLLAGDRILAVDDTLLADATLSNIKVMKLLKGKPDSKVGLKVLRKGKVENISITRGVIAVNSIDANIMLTSKIGYVKLSSFTMNSGKEFMKAAQELKEKGMRKMIFDLRNNGGGFLEAAKSISDQFLQSGKLIVYTEGRKTGRTNYISTRQGVLEDIDVIILINSYSASASEIVAGAIQDNDRGFILGRRSFGKGLVQDQQEFNDGSALRLTISRYYTPTGRSIQKPYGESIDYSNDFDERYLSGELFYEDSIKVVDSLQFTTPSGRVVYGGGGIYPDYFVPNDTVGASFYLSNLYYNSAFNKWVFKFLDRNRENWADFISFENEFRVTDQLLDEFTDYASGRLKIEKVESDFIKSKHVIKNRIKAEIARHLFKDNAYYQIYLKDDLDVKTALNKFSS